VFLCGGCGSDSGKMNYRRKRECRITGHSSNKSNGLIQERLENNYEKY
jgi:hypothetical protein